MQVNMNVQGTCISCSSHSLTALIGHCTGHPIWFIPLVYSNIAIPTISLIDGVAVRGGGVIIS